MGAIPLGKDGERFLPLPPPNTGFGGIWGVGRRPLDALWSGWSEGRKGRVGEKRPVRARILVLSRQPAWHDRLVAPVHVARQGGPRQRRRGAARARAASVSTLSRHMHWHDRGYLSCRGKWRD